MFARSFRSRHKVEKSGSRLKKVKKDPAIVAKLERSFEHNAPVHDSALAPPLVLISVGRRGRLFSAHQDVLSASPYFTLVLEHQRNGQWKRIDLPDEEPAIFSSILEYMYKSDYKPNLVYDEHRDSLQLEVLPSPDPSKISGGREDKKSTVFMSSVRGEVLRDTVIYCAAHRYGLDDLKDVALRKQGLHRGIEVGTIIRSARYAYDNTPDTDSRLRAHYLTLFVRSREVFMRSATMQAEMEKGGKLFFDLFVAMGNHVDELVLKGNFSSPRLF